MWEIIQTIIGLALLANSTGGQLYCYEDFSQCRVGEIVVNIDNDPIETTADKDDRWAIVASVYISVRHNFQASHYYYQVWWNWQRGMITADDALANVGIE